MKVVTQHYQECITVLYGNNQWQEREKNDIHKKNDDAAALEISIEGKSAIQAQDEGKRVIKSTPLYRALACPVYSGMFDADKAIASTIEKCNKEEQDFVYDIIGRNFLIGNCGSMTEEERQANISLGMKKAEYAADNFISEGNKSSFLNAMESIAKLASAGKMDADGNMDYGVRKASYLGHGSNLVYVTDTMDMMRTMDSNAYEEYQKIGKESNYDPIILAKYRSKWYAAALAKNPHMVNQYEAKYNEYIEKNVKNQKVNSTFKDLKTDSKSAFFESLKAFQEKNPDFLFNTINTELLKQFWVRL